MTNLGQVCLFSNLITILNQWCVGFGLVPWEQLFFYWFHNLHGDVQDFKRGEYVKKGEDQISKGEEFTPHYLLSDNRDQKILLRPVFSRSVFSRTCKVIKKFLLCNFIEIFIEMGVLL